MNIDTGWVKRKTEIYPQMCPTEFFDKGTILDEPKYKRNFNLSLTLYIKCNLKWVRYKIQNF